MIVKALPPGDDKNSLRRRYWRAKYDLGKWLAEILFPPGQGT